MQNYKKLKIKYQNDPKAGFLTGFEANKLKRKIFNSCLMFFILAFVFLHPASAEVSVENDISIKTQSGQNIILNNKEQKIKQGIEKAITQIKTTVNGKIIEDLKVQSSGQDKKVVKTVKDKNASVKTNVLIKKENLAIKKLEASVQATPKVSSFWEFILRLFSI